MRLHTCCRAFWLDLMCRRSCPSSLTGASSSWRLLTVEGVISLFVNSFIRVLLIFSLLESGLENTTTLSGILKTLALLMKFGKRDDLISYGRTVIGEREIEILLGLRLSCWKVLLLMKIGRAGNLWNDSFNPHLGWIKDGGIFKFYPCRLCHKFCIYYFSLNFIESENVMDKYCMDDAQVTLCLRWCSSNSKSAEPMFWRVASHSEQSVK